VDVRIVDDVVCVFNRLREKAGELFASSWRRRIDVPD